jgi:hypothetical protein
MPDYLVERKVIILVQNCPDAEFARAKSTTVLRASDYDAGRHISTSIVNLKVLSVKPATFAEVAKVERDV